MVLVRYYGSKSEAQWICVVFTTWHFSKIKISNKKKTPPNTVLVCFTHNNEKGV